MVNLDKWEEVEYDDIKAGDKVKAVYTYKDGSTSVRTGKIDHFDSRGYGITEGGQEVVHPGYGLRVHDVDGVFYRRKMEEKAPEPVLGAVIEASKRFGVGTRTERLVFDGLDWAGNHGRDFCKPEDLLGNFKNFKVLAPGVK